MQGLRQAMMNLHELDRQLVPRALVQAVNRVARRVITRSTRQVANETGVPQKLIRQRVRLRLATASHAAPSARLLINRGNLPAISLGAARMQLSRRKTATGRHGSVLKIGRFTFRNAFIQQLANGRWHVLQRTGRSRYPVQVVKIPLSGPLTERYQKESQQLMKTDIQAELAGALRQQLRLYVRKRV
ncbi:phage tail protein [Pantoea sp. SGAir0184]